ncbi:MAG: hypothetical protein GY838_01730 [bacterium]|nr:hypothetical protein [bacterium]
MADRYVLTTGLATNSHYTNYDTGINRRWRGWSWSHGLGLEYALDNVLY